MGIIIQTSEGIIKYFIKATMETFSPIQSMVVVISPIGDHAPPALAATMIIPAYQSLRVLSLTSFCNMVIKTIVAVKLSMIAERINAKKHMIHKILTLLFVLINFFIVEKPLKKSTVSTIVMAPIKKIKISAV